MLRLGLGSFAIGSQNSQVSLGTCCLISTFVPLLCVPDQSPGQADVPAGWTPKLHREAGKEWGGRTGDQQAQSPQDRGRERPAGF